MRILILASLSCLSLGPNEPAAEGTPAAESLDHLRDVRAASAAIEEPTVRAQALLVELREGTRDRDEVLAELRLALADVQAADEELAESLDAAEAALLTSP